MPLTRKQEAVREALFRAIIRCRLDEMAQALEDAHGWAGVHCCAGLPSLHLAAVLCGAPVTKMLVAAGAPVNAFLPKYLEDIIKDAPFLAALSWEERERLNSPGCTALSVACRRVCWVLLWLGPN